MQLSDDEIVKCLSAIRVELNFKMLCDQNWPIETLKLDDAASLRKFHLPWYRTSGEVDVGFSDHGASPVKTGDVADNLNSWPRRVAGISDYAEIFRRAQRADEVLPVYKLSEADDFLILDGCHRSVGLLLAEVPFNLTLVVIKGPIAKQALPDLCHYGG